MKLEQFSHKIFVLLPIYASHRNMLLGSLQIPFIISAACQHHDYHRGEKIGRKHNTVPMLKNKTKQKQTNKKKTPESDVQIDHWM